MNMSSHCHSINQPTFCGWILAVFLLTASSVAIASKPRPIDCAKARSIQVGMSERQVVQLLGKPYILGLGSGYMRYGWRDPQGVDKLDVQFDVLTEKIKERRVVVVDGSCAGEMISTLPQGLQAAIWSKALAEFPHGAELPRHITFGETDLHLGYVGEDFSQKIRFAEYVPLGQSLLRWREMVAVFIHGDQSTPTQKLSEMEEIAKRTKNPHFLRILAANDGSEAMGALPSIKDDYVEYQVARWTSVPDGVRAEVYFIRSYLSDGLAIDAFVERQASRAKVDSHSLDTLSRIVPPSLGENTGLTFTVNGRADGEVWVDPTVPPRVMPGK